MLKTHTGKSIKDPNYAPVTGTVFGQIFFCYNNIYDHLTEVAKKQKTFRILIPKHSALFTTDTRNIEHMLKTKFHKYSRGKLNKEIESDLFGEAVDGVFDMQDILMKCTLDSIFKIGFGVELNFLEWSTAEGTALMRAFDESNALIHWRHLHLRRTSKSLMILSATLSVLGGSCSPSTYIRMPRRICCQHFLMESEKDPEKMNDKYLRNIILNFMIAGKDTSANSLSWFFYVLCKNPLVQEKVAQVVGQVTVSQDDNVVGDFIARITDETLEQMHYLHATLTETLRLYLGVPLDGRCAKEDDILPDGFRMRKGDGLFYMAYAMGRMPYIWGEDAEDFRPERWLNNGIF
ncbi:heme binding protein, putative [Ricinus communis]|uniref:Heme binding protein, putative n=1 Tax=Ricinus communis TaxID=3988 RepID=B9RDF7_RICCO|nr:heme binding protein, putative [Ricinus communis]